MTSPAICTYNGSMSKWNPAKCSFHFTSKTKPKNLPANLKWSLNIPADQDNIGRFLELAKWAMRVVARADWVILEDYAFAAKGRVFHIGENGGILKSKLFEYDIPTITVAPTSVKKFATGSGRAQKDEIYEAFKKEVKGTDLIKLLTPKAKTVISPVSDIADSYFICKYAFEEYQL